MDHEKVRVLCHRCAREINNGQGNCIYEGPFCSACWEEIHPSVQRRINPPTSSIADMPATILGISQFRLLLACVENGFNAVAASIRAAAAVPSDVVNRSQAIEEIYCELVKKGNSDGQEK